MQIRLVKFHLTVCSWLQLVTGQVGRIRSNAAVSEVAWTSVDQTERNNVKGFNGPNGVHHRHPTRSDLSVHPNNARESCSINNHTLQEGRVAELIWPQ